MSVQCPHCRGSGRIEDRGPGVQHGQSGRSTPEYRSWRAMRARCLSPGSTGFEKYGGRGITVCERWSKFENFLADMGPRPHGRTLERIDNNGNYGPSNCRWATRKEQQANTSITHLITIDNVTKCLSDWCRQYGLDPGTVRRRMRVFGWGPKQAVTTPKMRARTSAFERGGAQHAIEPRICARSDAGI